MNRPMPPERPGPSSGRPTRSAGTPAGAPRLSRRRFLATAALATAAAGAGSALRPAAAFARRLARDPLPLQPWALPARAPAEPVEFARAVMGAAVLAPSHWNAQPWRMEWDPGTIRLVADPARALPTLDPDRRSMLIGVGAALENMLVALRAYGQQPVVAYFPSERDRAQVASVSWTPADAPRDRLLFGAIPERRTNRRGYDGRGLFPENRLALNALIPSELRLHWIEEHDAIRAVAEMTADATEAQVRDAKAQRERYAWMRFGDGEARRRGDGITVDALELGGPARWLAGRYFDPSSFFLGFGAGSAAKQARDDVRSSGALVLLSAPQGGDLAAVTAGQAFERFALRATTLGVAHQPISAPIEVARFHDDLLRAFGAIGEEPMLFVRLGHARRPGPSVRRAVSQVASFRNS